MPRDIAILLPLAGISISILGLFLISLYFLLTKHFGCSIKKSFWSLFFFLCGMRVAAMFFLPQSVEGIILFILVGMMFAFCIFFLYIKLMEYFSRKNYGLEKINEANSLPNIDFDGLKQSIIKAFKENKMSKEQAKMFYMMAKNKQLTYAQIKQIIDWLTVIN